MIYLKCWKGKNLQPRLSYPARLSFRIERDLKSFSDKQKLKEFISAKLTLSLLKVEKKRLWQEIRNYKEGKIPKGIGNYMVKEVVQSLKLVWKFKDKNYGVNHNYNRQLRDMHEDVKYDIKETKCWEGSIKCRSFRMYLNLNDYQFKTSRYRLAHMNPMVNTNQKPTIDTQKLEGKEHKLTNTSKAFNENIAKILNPQERYEQKKGKRIKRYKLLYIHTYIHIYI